MGRPPKEESEKVIVRQVSFDPEVWAAIERALPRGERSRFINAAVRAALENADEAGSEGIVE
jgi:hypothetical protein